MASGDDKGPLGKKPGDKSSLSAGDLRARLGLKSGGPKSATDIRAKLGLGSPGAKPSMLTTGPGIPKSGSGGPPRSALPPRPGGNTPPGPASSPSKPEAPTPPGPQPKVSAPSTAPAMMPPSAPVGLVNDDENPLAGLPGVGPPTNRISQDILDSLKDDVLGGGGLDAYLAKQSEQNQAPQTQPSDGLPGYERPPNESPAAEAEEEKKPESSTHALSFDEFEGMLLNSGDADIVGLGGDEANEWLQGIEYTPSMVGPAVKKDPSSGLSLGTTPSPAVAPAPTPAPTFQPASGEDATAMLDESMLNDPALRVDDDLLDGMEEGDATAMIDTTGLFDDEEEEEEEEFDAFPEEHTQIMTPAMDYEPLTGRLFVISGDAPQSEYLLARDKTTVGRGTTNGITIADIAMSRKHCVFERFAEGFVCRDMDSGNGTFVNDRRVVYAELRDGDIAEIGNVRFRYEQSGGDPEKLWKGLPNIQFHADDTGATRQAPQAPRAAVASATQSDGPMIQRQMPAGMGPYGWGQQQGYPPGFGQMGVAPPPAKAKNSPVITTLIVFFSILLVGLIVVIVWSLVQQSGQPEPAGVSEPSAEEKRQRAQEFVQQGSEFFDNRRWEEARTAFSEALKLDPDNATAKLFVNEVIDREKATEERVRKAIEDIRRDPSTTNFENGLTVLTTMVPADSLFSSEVRNKHVPIVKKEYKRHLLREVQKSIDAKKFAKARRDLNKIEKDLDGKGTAEVKALRQKIEKAKAEK